MYKSGGLLFMLLLGILCAKFGWIALLWAPLGFILGIFISANMILPILMGVPIATSLIIKKQMRATVYFALLRAPIIWLIVFVLLGWFFPNGATWLYNNAPINISANLGFLLIILSPLSKKSRQDFRDDFDKAWGNYYTDQENFNRMNKLSFTSLIRTYFLALIAFAITGWIGLIGIILIILRIIGVIHWAWWIASLPLEYGAIYCLYMTIDGAKYRAGLKEAGTYAGITAPFLQSEDFQIQTIIKEGPEYIGETIDRLCNEQSRLKFNQALVDASLQHYYLLQLAMFGNKEVNAHTTIKKWKESGLTLPEEGTPEFS